MSKFIPCAYGNNPFAEIAVSEFGDLVMVGDYILTKQDGIALIDAIAAICRPVARTREMERTPVCPTCKHKVGAFNDFETRDGISIKTYWCKKCQKDVVPMLSEVVNSDPAGE